MSSEYWSIENGKLPAFVAGEFWAEQALQDGANPYALLQAARNRQRNRWNAALSDDEWDFFLWDFGDEEL